MRRLSKKAIKEALTSGQIIFRAFVPLIPRSRPGVPSLTKFIPKTGKLSFEEDDVNGLWLECRHHFLTDGREREFACFTNYWFAYAFMRKHGHVTWDHHEVEL